MRTLTAIAVLVLLGGEAAAQTTDAKLWVSGGADAGVGKRVRLEAEQELRVGADSAFDQTHTQVGLGVRVKKWVRVGALYRFIVMDGEERHRLAGEGEFVSPGRLQLSARARLQATTRPGNDTQLLVRVRGKAEYRATKRLQPFASIEVHHQVSPNEELREVRLTAGVEWRLTKDLDLAGFYLYQHESNVGNPERNHVLGLAAVYHFGDVR